MTRQQKDQLRDLSCSGRPQRRRLPASAPLKTPGPRPLARCLRRAACLLLALLALGNSGCLLVAAGAAAGGAATWFYYKGKVCQDFPSTFPDTWAAVQTSLQELSLPLVSNQNDGRTGTLTSRTTDNATVTIDLEVVPSRIRAEGTFTRVCIRVGAFGDEAVSARILAQISAHLVPAGAGQPPGTGTPPALPAGSQPVPAWTPVPGTGSPAPPPPPAGPAAGSAPVPAGPIRPVAATAPTSVPETAPPPELP